MNKRKTSTGLLGPLSITVQSVKDQVVALFDNAKTKLGRKEVRDVLLFVNEETQSRLDSMDEEDRAAVHENADA